MYDLDGGYRVDRDSSRLGDEINNELVYSLYDPLGEVVVKTSVVLGKDGWMITPGASRSPMSAEEALARAWVLREAAETCAMLAMGTRIARGLGTNYEAREEA